MCTRFDPGSAQYAKGPKFGLGPFCFGFRRTGYHPVMRLLLVEDSPSLQRSVSEGLRRTGYAVDVAGDGSAGVTSALASDYDAIILDIMLPIVDGISVLKQIRDKGKTTPVVMLTAKDTVADKILGLRSGADDYLVKPFNFDELVARLQAVIRRAHGASASVLSAGPLKIDTAARTVHFQSISIPLSPREYAVLEYLAHRIGKPVPRPELEEHLYDDRSQVNSNAVDVAVYGLRSKLEAAGCPQVVQTRRGFGYLLSETAG